MTLKPLYVDGRRDKARRFIDTVTGEIISRRQQIIRTEGMTPEQKAKIPTHRIRKGRPPKNLIQLVGDYQFKNIEVFSDKFESKHEGQFMVARGFSTARKKREYADMHEEAVNYALATVRGETDTPSGAWLLHQHRNPHHWQHWIIRQDRGKVKVLPMPDEFVREMVADWIGAGIAQGHGNDVLPWYEKNKGLMTLHPETRLKVESLLKTISVMGYDDN